MVITVNMRIAYPCTFLDIVRGHFAEFFIKADFQNFIVTRIKGYGHFAGGPGKKRSVFACVGQTVLYQCVIVKYKIDFFVNVKK